MSDTQIRPPSEPEHGLPNETDPSATQNSTGGRGSGRNGSPQVQLYDQDDPTSLAPPGPPRSDRSRLFGATVQSTVTGTAVAVPEIRLDGTPGPLLHPVPAQTPPPAGSAERSLTRGLVRLARPQQWIKNFLVFVAPAAAGVLLQRSVLWHGAAAFGIFCLAASGTYFLNDAVDAQVDRLHPTKRLRPVAAGIVPVPLALTSGVVMMAAAVVLGGLLAGRDLAVVIALYGLVNVGYSMGLKNEAVLDLALVSAGFVLRAIAGGVATGVALSHWFIIVASFGSLLVVTGKRSGEKNLLSNNQIDQAAVRQTLTLYSPEFLRTVRTLSAAVTVTAYCLWAFERASQVHAGHDPIWFQLSIVPFVIALLHVVRLLDSGAGAAPEELAIHDHRLQIYGICWIALFVIGTYA